MVATRRQKRRPNFPVDFKRQIAQQACEPGVSVSQLAQQNGINANMLFKWRRHFLAGLFNTTQGHQVMLPVAIVEAPELSAPVVKTKRQTDAVTVPAADAGVVRRGVIEIQIADVTVRIDGHADLATLRSVIGMLRA
jgi:transposase